MSRPWSRSTKQWVAVGLVLLGVGLLRLLWPFLTPVALALLLTYILSPIVVAVERRTGWPHLGATATVYLLLIMLLVAIPTTVIPTLVSQLSSFSLDLADVQIELLSSLESLQASSFMVAGRSVDTSRLIEPVITALRNNVPTLVPTSVNIFFGVATSAATGILWLILILVLSFYLVRDADQVNRYLWRLVPEDMVDETAALVTRINTIWYSFLRGQLVLSLVVGIAVALVLTVLGVPNALLLGLLAGTMEMIPNVGPTLAAIPAIALAFFSGSNNWPISNELFAVIVAVAYFLIQQVENHYLVPRIIGGSVQLHPAVVLIGALIGASLSGIIGIFLAAPTLASLRVLVGYAYNKILDRPVAVLTSEPPLPPDPSQSLEPPRAPIAPPAGWQTFFQGLRQGRTAPERER